MSLDSFLEASQGNNLMSKSRVLHSVGATYINDRSKNLLAHILLTERTRNKQRSNDARVLTIVLLSWTLIKSHHRKPASFMTFPVCFLRIDWITGYATTIRLFYIFVGVYIDLWEISDYIIHLTMNEINVWKHIYVYNTTPISFTVLGQFGPGRFGLGCFGLDVFATYFFGVGHFGQLN